MKKLLLCVLFLMLCAGSAFSSAKNYAEGEVLVVFKAPEGVKVSVSGLGEGGMLRASVSRAAAEVDSQVLDNPLSHTRDFNHELDSLIKLLLLSFLFPRVRLLLSYAAIDLRKQALDQRYKSLLVTVWLSMRAKVPLCLGEAPAPVSVL